MVRRQHPVAGEPLGHLVTHLVHRRRVGRTLRVGIDAGVARPARVAFLEPPDGLADLERLLEPAGLEARLEFDGVPLQTLRMLGALLALAPGADTQHTGLLAAALEPHLGARLPLAPVVQLHGRRDTSSDSSRFPNFAKISTKSGEAGLRSPAPASPKANDGVTSPSLPRRKIGFRRGLSGFRPAHPGMIRAKI